MTKPYLHKIKLGALAIMLFMAICSWAPTYTAHASGHLAGYDLVPPSTPAGAPAAPRPDPIVNTVGDEANPILRVLHWFVVNTFGWLVAVAGVTFDYSITAFTIGFGALYESSNLGFTINAIWGTVRDIFNLTFIFGLVYIGFKMILDSSDSNARKMLISLLGAALLVNFSLFITKFVIDFSNIAAFKVYEAFQSVSGAEVGSIANSFMVLLGVSGTLSVEYNTSGGFAYIFGLMIVLMVLTYVFLAGAILLLVRFVVLNIYMVFSPVMFLGWVFPSMAGQSKKYWGGFLSQAFFAPAFLFMIYLTYRVADSYNGGLQKDMAAAFAGSGAATTVGITQVIPFFAMVIVFLLASMMVAKKMGGQGAAFSIGMADKAKNYAVGGMANAGRWSLDRISRNDGQEKPNQSHSYRALRSLARGAGRTATALGARTALESAAKPYTSANKARDDAKAGLASRDSIAEKEAKIQAGIAAQNTSMIGLNPTQITARQLAIDTMKQLAQGLTIEQLEKMSDKNRLGVAAHVTSNLAEKVSESKELSLEQRKEFTAARIEAVKALVSGNVDEVAKLSLEALEMMGEPWVTAQINAGNIKQSQIDDLKKSKKYSDEHRNAFAATYKNQQNASVKRTILDPTTGALDNDKLSRLTPAELEKLTVDELKTYSPFINSTQMDNLSKNRKIIKDDDMRELEETQKNKSIQIASDPALIGQLFNRKPAESAKLPREVLLNINARQYLTPEILEVIGQKRTLGTTDRAALKNAIMTGSRTAPFAALQGWFLSPDGIDTWK